MKICIPLMVWLTCICIKVHAQNSIGVVTAEEVKEENTSAKTGIACLATNSPVSPVITNNIQLPATNHDQAYLIQKSKAQKLNGMVLLTGGSVVSLLGIRSIMDVSNSYTPVKNPLQVNGFENNSHSRLALTGLVLIAGSIPYFINAIKNKKLAGLKLACQKTFIGTNKKACRKVTGITFAIPIGK